MSKHTPLPWALKTFSDGAFILTEGIDVGDPKHCVIASRNEHDRPEESIANAELMADAPKLLEAIRGLLDVSLIYPHGSVKARETALALLNKHGG